MNKLFVISLPRTGTTSVCGALLDCGYQVAHTALSQHSFELADVIADTPCYCDYPQLDRLFPGSKFVYLERSLDAWLPSIQMLLGKLLKYIQADGSFHPLLKRCFSDTFDLSKQSDPLKKDHLVRCYEKHKQAVCSYFEGRNDWLRLDVSDPNGLTHLLQFMGNDIASNPAFPHLNAGRMVTAWKDIKHTNKVNSNASGPRRRKYFEGL